MQAASGDSEQLEDRSGDDRGQQAQDVLDPRDPPLAASVRPEPASSSGPPVEDQKWRAKTRQTQKRYRDRQRDLKQQHAAEREQQGAEILCLSQRNAALIARNMHLEQLLQLAHQKSKHEQQQLVRRTEKGRLEPLIFEEGKAALLNIRGPYVLRRDCLNSFSLKQFLPLFKGLVSSMHDCLIHCKATSAPQSSHQIEVAVSQYLFVCYNVYRSNMMLAHEIRLTDWESFCPLVAVPDDKWIDILDTLKLSWDQKRNLVAACNGYLASLGQISQQQISLGKAQGDWASRPSTACLRKMIAANAEFMRAIKLEHEAYGQLAVFFYTKVLTPVQVAVLTVKTWPVAADLIAIGSVAESQLQDQCVHAQHSSQLASQQPCEPDDSMHQLDWLDILSAELAQPSSRVHKLPAAPSSPTASAHRQSSEVESSREPSSAAAPLPDTAASAVISPADSALELPCQLPNQPAWIENQGAIGSRSAAPHAVCELQPPSAKLPFDKGSVHPRSSVADSTSRPWHSQGGIQNGFRYEPCLPADALQTAAAAAATPAQRRGQYTPPTIRW